MAKHKSILRSPFRYSGGKSKSSIIQRIKKYFPEKIDEYRECCVGGGGVFFSIPQNAVKRRWINDLDENLISVYLALKDRPEAFIASCKAIEAAKDGEPLTSARKNGREIHNARLKAKFDELANDPNADPALRYFFINRTVWLGRVNYNEKSQLYFSSDKGWDIVDTNRLERVAEHMKDVKITCLDYRKVLEEPGQDGEEVLIYVDPPYVVNTSLSKSRRLYAYNFEMQDHYDFAEEVKKCRHKVLVSYDDDKKGIVRSLFKEEDGFHIFEAEWAYCGSGNKKKSIGKELIITNYQVEKGEIFDDLDFL